MLIILLWIVAVIIFVAWNVYFFLKHQAIKINNKKINFDLEMVFDSIASFHHEIAKLKIWKIWFICKVI